MRPRFVTALLIFLAAVLAFIFWLRPKHGAIVSTPSQEVVQPTNGPASNGSSIIQNLSHRATVSSAPMPKQLAMSDIKTPEGFKRYVEAHNVSVDFYGKVIDQDSNALSGVYIKVVVDHWTMPNPAVLLVGSKDTSLERVTGADGRFELTGATGDGFDLVSFQKDGYQRESGQRSFGATGGSYANPVIFKMWSNGVHEKLIVGEKVFHIVPDGEPYFINVTDGTISESGTGDLKVWVKRPERVTYGQRYDWSCEIDTINGGLLEQSRGSAMYEAPAEGYVSSFQFEQTVGSGWGDSTGQREFYITLNNGREYGRLSIDLYAYYNQQIPAMIRLSYAINPSGSRVLR